MPKIDFKKEFGSLFKPSPKQAALVEVPPLNYLMIDGRGDPNTAQAYQEAIEALFAVSYTLKFLIKKGAQAVDYTVMPLEGLWWVEDMARFSIEDKSDWLWTAMIMQPAVVTSEKVNLAVEQVAKKKNPPGLSRLRFESYDEGTAAQIMHVGPFAAEGPTIERLHTFIKGNGYAPTGKHHEIYLSDFRKAAPEKLQTIIRQPVQKQ